MQLSFYNTIGLEGELLKKAQEECGEKDAEILTFFINNHTQSYTPLEVWDRVGGLFTSVRRSISTLTKRGFLEKTSQRIQERFGKVNYKWRVKINGKV